MIFFVFNLIMSMAKYVNCVVDKKKLVFVVYNNILDYCFDLFFILIKLFINNNFKEKKLIQFFVVINMCLGISNFEVFLKEKSVFRFDCMLGSNNFCFFLDFITEIPTTQLFVANNVLDFYFFSSQILASNWILLTHSTETCRK